MVLNNQAQVLPLWGASLFNALGAERPFEATWSNPFVLLMGKLRRGRKVACLGIQQNQVPNPGVLTPTQFSFTNVQRESRTGCSQATGSLLPREAALCYLPRSHEGQAGQPGSRYQQGQLQGEAGSPISLPESKDVRPRHKPPDMLADSMQEEGFQLS